MAKTTGDNLKLAEAAVASNLRAKMDTLDDLEDALKDLKASDPGLSKMN